MMWSSFFTQHDGIHIFLLCKSYSSRWDTWDQVSSTLPNRGGEIKNSQFCLHFSLHSNIFTHYANHMQIYAFSSAACWAIESSFIIIIKFE